MSDHLLDKLIKNLVISNNVAEAIELQDLLEKTAAKKGDKRVIKGYGSKTIPAMKAYLKGGAKYKEGGAFDNSACIADLEGSYSYIDNPAAVCRAAEKALTGKTEKTRRKKGG